jgi:hypothetical protein
VTDPRLTQLEYEISHRHADGTYGRMEEHHDPAQHDTERAWGFRRIFKCTTCEETITLIPNEEGGAPDRR